MRQVWIRSRPTTSVASVASQGIQAPCDQVNRARHPAQSELLSSARVSADPRRSWPILSEAASQPVDDSLWCGDRSQAWPIPMLQARCRRTSPILESSQGVGGRRGSLSAQVRFGGRRFGQLPVRVRWVALLNAAVCRCRCLEDFTQSDAA